MTRKEELERRALSFLANEHVEPSDLTAMLLQVEREVWLRVTKKYCEMYHEYTNYSDSFGDWLTAQQQELT
jgi:hypothetical protein